MSNKYDVKRIRHPTQAHKVRVTPEFRKEPDIEKMVHALIAIAEKMASEKHGAAATDRKRAA